MQRYAFMAAILCTGCLGDGATAEFESLEEGAAELFGDGDEGAGTTYRYRTADGRWAFTGSLDMVPPEQRPGAEEMDLSEVSLNTELGNSIAASVTEAHERLAESDECTEADRAARQSAVDRMWTHHRPTLAIAALAVLLLFALPMLGRHIGAPLAGRIVTFALPILGLLGAMTFGLVEAREGIARARETSDLCSPESFAAASARERVERLERLDAVLAREGAVHVRDN